MYQNTSHELLRRGLVDAGIVPNKIAVLASDPSEAMTEYGVAVPNIHLVDLMDRTDLFAANMRKIHRIMVPRLFAYYDSKRKAWIVRFQLRLMQAFEV